MVQAVTLYRCDICREIFETEEEAMHCQVLHDPNWGKKAQIQRLQREVRRLKGELHEESS